MRDTAQPSLSPYLEPTIRRSADLSDCETYRYDLTREWDSDLPKVVWIMLNPSIADERVDDPKDGAPRHPLYLKTDTAPQPWKGAAPA